MNVVLWVQYDTVRTQKKTHGQSLLKPAMDVLNKIEPVKIIGGVESVPMPINKLDTIDKSEVAALDYDLILVTGHDVDLAPILDEAKELGLDCSKFVLDSTVCKPGFSLDSLKKVCNAPAKISAPAVTSKAPVTSKISATSAPSMNVVLWVQYDTVRTQNKAHGKSLLKPAMDVLNKLETVKIIGVVESIPTPINKLDTIDKSEISALDYDLILVTGHDVDLAPILAEATELGLDLDKIVLDRTVLVPGFTPARYKELRNSNLSILSMGWWAGLAYHRFGLPKLSPTVGMYTSEESFMNFLPEARWHLKKDLHFAHTEYNVDLGINFPVFWLDGTQWFMNSFTDDADALETWNALKEKINWSNVLVTMHTSSPAILERFDCLPYAKKACFVPFETELESGFYLSPEFCGGNLLQASEGVVNGTVAAYDVWDLLLYGKKTALK
ncbi:MAG: DUF1919 domain-containing protein [Selenomonadaceae bacterium]|nr:DUF1919 domain-containing protein [Selenomonadaceae bacterium]